MDLLGTTTTIFSLTTPGATILSGQASRALARRANTHASTICSQNPTKYGFFGSLPSLLDVEGCLLEIPHALDTLGAQGFILFTRYGPENTYLGSPLFRPIWSLLNARGAVVLVHPSMPLDPAPFPPTLLPNITEFVHETTRTAVDLIFSNTKRDHPDVKIILSHAGGTLPYLIGRISLMELLPYAPVHKSADEIFAEAKSFYYDLALSGHENVLRALLGFVGEDHVLFGSDYPYCPIPGLGRMNDGWEGFEVSREVRDKVNYRNAMGLLPMFRDQKN
jgi:6-methylsalicylate decarboxylase